MCLSISYQSLHYEKSIKNETSLEKKFNLSRKEYNKIILNKI